MVVAQVQLHLNLAGGATARRIHVGIDHRSQSGTPCFGFTIAYVERGEMWFCDGIPMDDVSLFLSAIHETGHRGTSWHQAFGISEKHENWRQKDDGARSATPPQTWWRSVGGLAVGSAGADYLPRRELDGGAIARRYGGMFAGDCAAASVRRWGEGLARDPTLSACLTFLLSPDFTVRGS